MNEDAPSPIPYRRAWMAAVSAFLVHNIEEIVLDLPRWSAAHPALPWLAWMEQPGAFTLAVGVLSLAVGLCAIYAIATGPSWSGRALAIFSSIMLLNAASHVALSVMTSSPMPGVVTALLVITPVMLGVLWAIRRRA